MFLFTDTQRAIESEHEERQIALEYLAEAWNNAEEEGVESESLAHAALFAALATLVRSYDEEGVAALIAKLPERIRNGEYSLDRSIQ